MSFDPPPRFAPASNPVDQLHATLPVVSARDGSPLLPDFVRWAFALNEGDLLAVSPEEGQAGAFRFLSYSERAWSAAEACRDPWPYLEELLRRPMAALGPDGVLWLPQEAEALRAGTVLLRVEADTQGRSFTCEPLVDGMIERKQLLVAHYLLPVHPEFQVMLPEDLMWVFDLEKGSQLAYTAGLAMAEYESYELKKPPQGRSLTQLGPGGLLALPEPWRVSLVSKPNAQVRLDVTFASDMTLRLRPGVE
jgi:hypothetical protein